MPALPPPLLYADTERSADALYFGRVDVPDPFVAFGHGGKKYAIVSALEFGRVRRTSDFDVVLPLEEFHRRARERWTDRRPGPAEVIFLAAGDVRRSTFTVPDDFPAGVYARLVELGLQLKIAPGPLFPEREIKTAREAAAIREGNRCSSLGFAAAERILRGARIKGHRLVYRGRTVTSEMLKFAIESACLEAGAVSANTIVAGGDQACDPHDRGTGPIRPNELVILDIFPRVTATGYYGDMTRTFLRGRASDAQRALVAAVREAQLAALGVIRAGANGRDVHRRCVEVFEARGFRTEHGKRGSVGFFHGTGHGLGLAVHEAPRMSGSIDYTLRGGSVVTVEPGLYYPGLGGCRVEVFEARGFRTEHGKRGSVGFFHGTGHGLGLAVHEAPRMSGSIDYTLRGGSVVTVEPGLYYPGLGGCRVEDVVQVTSGAPKPLSRYHYEWELR